ncbi:ABC transporter permease [Limobrevibacterium gyesilva]|uniref:ABC transporter permease n=1 Tax=Limobrevibacterium gyesilva TaxID=2991712 RepID=A0AA41YUV8_9PROT|nr:ABC transporter permease [Limobrevibacterium gyesilva]MCW3475842.1 ABC transporter permease [Limobrevibacterium gyesilva]
MNVAALATPSAHGWVRQIAGPVHRVLKVLFSVLLTFLGLTCVTFVIGRVIPIDPVLAIVGDKAPPDVYARVRAEIGLDLPLPVQYWRYLMKVLHGDFGNSVITSQPVLADLLHVFPATLELSLLALIIGVIFGVPIGVIAATHRGRWQDQVIRFGSLLGYSMPVFWLGLVGLLAFYAKLGWVEGPGRLDVGFDDIVPTVTGLIVVDSLIAGEHDVFVNALSHLVLPASILGYLSLAYVARMTRSFMLSQLRQEYVLAALAKGLSPFRVVWVHALGNAWVQLITVIALTFGSLLEGAVLTETVFAWPGLGLYMKNSLFNADLNAVLGGTMLVGVVYIGLNMLSDLLYPLVDPRARESS